ncbi:KilA-N domain-containing protein [Candidatus Halobeggiatoa sp. HSG11]|nr:KilA-N domain-containing protein [Candidatus Halobeggiatoa sp. HSG11]
MTNQMMISRNFHGAVIRQRSSDGYLDATAMCKINGKHWFNYYRTKETQGFLIALSKSTGLPIESQNDNSHFGENKGLVEITRGGNNAGIVTFLYFYTIKINYIMKNKIYCFDKLVDTLLLVKLNS